jgi:hypothetical protein
MGNPNDDARRLHSRAESRVASRRAQTNDMPDTDRGKWEMAEQLLLASRDNLVGFAGEVENAQEDPERQGALEMAEALEGVISALNGPVLLGYKPQG